MTQPTLTARNHVGPGVRSLYLQDTYQARRTVHVSPRTGQGIPCVDLTGPCTLPDPLTRQLRRAAARANAYRS